MEIPNARKFLNYFNEIDALLKNKVEDFYLGLRYSDMVRYLAERDRLVKRFEHDLIQFGYLRNAIVHQFRDFKVIAEPTDEVIEELKLLVEIFEKPPSVNNPKYIHPVSTTRIDEPVTKVLKTMSELSFSQLPVMKDGKVVEILSNNTIARWLEANREHGWVDLKDLTVVQLMHYVEIQENFVIVDRDMTAFEVIEIFIEEGHLKGHMLDACLITQNGNPTDKLLGIITAADLADLARMRDGKK